MTEKMTTRSNALKVSCAAVGTALLAGAAVTPAWATQTHPDSITAIATIAPEVFDNLATTASQTQARTSEDVFPNGGSVSLPDSPSDPLVLENDLNPALSFTLPIESDLEEVAPSSGLFIYPAGTNAELIPVVKDDGSVQVTTVLSASDAPTRFDYVFAPGSNAQLSEDGFVVITSEAGEYTGAITPPWARDANGTDVPTHFEVDGTTLTQVVNHAGFAYPVVADPYAGKALISSVGVGTENGQPRYSVTKTTFGHSVSLGYGLGGQDDPLLGAAIMRNQGWSEAVSKGLNTATTIRQQYDCHTVYAAGKNPWNLERFRGTNDWWGVNPQLCNW